MVTPGATSDFRFGQARQQTTRFFFFFTIPAVEMSSRKAEDKKTRLNKKDEYDTLSAILSSLCRWPS